MADSSQSPPRRTRVVDILSCILCRLGWHSWWDAGGGEWVCLDCGKEFGYDWNTMRIGNPVAAPVQTSLLTAHSK